ncbi:MAG: hypothetical protein ACYC6L_10665 [Anaerolineae bacterium]
MPNQDRVILRDLAKRVKEIAELPIMAERRQKWVQHNRLAPGKPLILVFPEGSWRELLPDSECICADSFARAHIRARTYPG